MKVINTEKAPGAIGPYSQGFVVGNLVITSGQIPVNPADGSVGPPAAAWPSRPCPRTSCARSRLPPSCKRRLSIPIKKSKKRCCVLQQRFLSYS